MSEMNYNLLTQTDFRAIIADEKAKEFDYFLQTCNIPSISINSAPTPYKNRRSKMPGETVEYSPLSFTFLVAEDLANFKYIHDWILSTRNEDDKDKWFKDITIHALTNNKGVNMDFVFRGCFPTNLGDIRLESNVSDTQPIICNATFEYEYYDIVTRKE